MADLKRRQIKWFGTESDLLDKLYNKRMEEWQRLINMYNLQFDEKIRDLSKDELVRIPRFYPIVRQIIATVAFNHPKVFFAIEEDEGEGLAEILERAAENFMNLANVRSHAHQAIFDALPCSIGWIRLDYNPPGDDMIPPYVANDAMHEDLVAVNRVPPGHVHVDPQCPPHVLGHARYIREKMWVPLEHLKNDDQIQHKSRLKATKLDRTNSLHLGEVMGGEELTGEQEAIRESVDNGEMVLCDRWHIRDANGLQKQLIMFAPDIEEPILMIDHPFRRMVFDQKTGILGNPLFEDDGTPLMDLDSAQPGIGMLVENAFPFVPMKFDLDANSFYPPPHLRMIEDIQTGIVESMSRQASLLKRQSRQGIVNEEESKKRPELKSDLARGVDGEWHDVLDVNNFKPLEYGSIPPDQILFQRELEKFEEDTTQVNELKASGTDVARTATESSLIASAASINREWMELAVSNFYMTVVRNAFQIMGDPRYEPGNFVVNSAPQGQPRLTRALRNADFLWNFRVKVQAGSMQPLFEQLQRSQYVDFYDRANLSPNFDKFELDKTLASAYDLPDVEKMMVSPLNPEAVRAAQLENQYIITRGTDPGVLLEQDHRTHVTEHQNWQKDPTFTQLSQTAQQLSIQGQQVNQQAGQQLQQAAQAMEQHMQAHGQMEQQNETSVGSPRTTVQDTIENQVQSNAGRITEAQKRDAVDLT